MKKRIKGILNHKKPAFWVVCLAIIICMVSAICLLTNPRKVDDFEEKTTSDPSTTTFFSNGVVLSAEEEENGNYLITVKLCKEEENKNHMYKNIIHYMDEEQIQIKYHQDLKLKAGDKIGFSYFQMYVDTRPLPVGQISLESPQILEGERILLGWKEEVLDNTSYNDKICVQLTKEYYSYITGNKKLGIRCEMIAYKSVDEHPKYLEVYGPQVYIIGTESGKYSGGSSAVVSDGVIQFNLNGCIDLKCKGQTTEDGALNFMDLQNAGFQIQAANGQSAPSQRKTIQIAENITSETVTTMTQE